MNRVYALHDPRDGAVRYIGITKQTIEARLRDHIKNARVGDQTYRARWMRQLFDLGLLPTSTLIEETWDRRREIDWIDYYRKAGAILTNLTGGGDGCIGRQYSRESLQRISEGVSAAMMGHEVSPETRQKISRSNRGKPLSEERRRKISEAMKGKPKSAEHRAKTAVAATGRPHSDLSRQKIADASRERWSTEEHREKVNHGQSRHRQSVEQNNGVVASLAVKLGAGTVPAESDQG